MDDRAIRRPKGTLRAAGAVLVAFLALGALPLRAEDNPFLPPSERQAEADQRLQKRIDRAVAAMEDRLTRALLDALDGKTKDGQLPRPLQDAVSRRSAAVSPAAAGPLPPGLPGLPPLPASSDPVPAGAVFIGCLDGKAFFQDRGGSPFLIDPRAFPPAAGGAAACAM